MEKQTSNNYPASKLFLFPRQYMFIGKLLTAFAIIGIIFNLSGMGLTLSGESKTDSPILITFYIVLLIGLFTMAWTREKIEDEFTIRWRFLSMSISFILAILVVIGFPLFAIFTGEKLVHLNATYVVIGMLITYLASYNILKGFYKED